MDQLCMATLKPKLTSAVKKSINSYFDGVKFSESIKPIVESNIRQWYTDNGLAGVPNDLYSLSDEQYQDLANYLLKQQSVQFPNVALDDGVDILLYAEDQIRKEKLNVLRTAEYLYLPGGVSYDKIIKGPEPVMEKMFFLTLNLIKNMKG